MHGTVGVIVGIVFYTRSWAFNHTTMMRKYKRVMRGRNYWRTFSKMSEAGKRLSGGDKVEVETLAKRLWGESFPIIKMGEPELRVVRRLERFIKMRKGVAIPIRERLTKPELRAVRRLERFIRKRRKIAEVPAEEEFARIRERLGKKELEEIRRLEELAKKRRPGEEESG